MVEALKQLPFRARLTYGAHLFKALVRQHHGEFIPLLKPLVPDDGVVIDVGAHAGQFTKLFAKMAPQGHVFAFEPASYARSIVAIVTKLHGLKNVTIAPLGLSDRPGRQTLSIPLKSSGSLGYGLSHLGDDGHDRPSYKEDIELVTLDSYVRNQGIRKVSLIKADIEGWEMRFLMGAEETIAKFKPAVFLEINAQFLARAGNTPDEVWAFFKKHGYRIERITQTGTEPAPQPFERGDVVCAPMSGI